MKQVKVTLSDEMVKFLEGLYETQQKLAVAADHIDAASDALKNLGLGQDDVAAIVASRSGVTKTAVRKIMTAVRRRDLDAYEILAMYLSVKENVGRDQARRVIKGLMDVIDQVKEPSTTAMVAAEGSQHD